MSKSHLFLAGLLGLGVSATSLAQPIPIVGLVELSGTARPPAPTSTTGSSLR